MGEVKSNIESNIIQILTENIATKLRFKITAVP